MNFCCLPVLSGLTHDAHKNYSQTLTIIYKSPNNLYQDHKRFQTHPNLKPESTNQTYHDKSDYKDNSLQSHYS